MQPSVIKTLCRKALGQSPLSNVLSRFWAKSVFLTHVILDLRLSNPRVWKDDTVFENFPVFHIPCEAPGLLRCFRTDRWPCADLPGSPKCGWLRAVSASVLSIRASHGTASSPEENFHIRASLSLLCPPHRRLRGCIQKLFSRVAKEIYAWLYFLLIKMDLSRAGGPSLQCIIITRMTGASLSRWAGRVPQACFSPEGRKPPTLQSLW